MGNLASHLVPLAHNTPGSLSEMPGTGPYAGQLAAIGSVCASPSRPEFTTEDFPRLVNHIRCGGLQFDPPEWGTPPIGPVTAPRRCSYIYTCDSRRGIARGATFGWPLFGRSWATEGLRGQHSPSVAPPGRCPQSLNAGMGGGPPTISTQCNVPPRRARTTPGLLPDQAPRTPNRRFVTEGFPPQGLACWALERRQRLRSTPSQTRYKLSTWLDLRSKSWVI